MSTIVLRITFLAFLALIQASFLNVLFPSEGLVPFVLFSFAVAATLLLGFDRAIGPVVLLGILVDLLVFDRLGIGVFFAVGISYTISFFSRRFLFEHPMLSAVFSVALCVTAGILLPIFARVISFDGEAFSEIGRQLSWHRFLFSFGLGTMTFLAVSFMVESFERRMAYGDSTAKLKW
jgi:cell shape-determining protein MreD